MAFNEINKVAFRELAEYFVSIGATLGKKLAYTEFIPDESTVRQVHIDALFNETLVKVQNIANKLTSGAIAIDI